MHRTVLVAVGGNALLRACDAPTIAAERARVSEVARGIAHIVAEGWRVVLTHGNGPQVGAELLRSERAAGEAYPLPLDVCVACTQGEIGCLLQQALASAFGAEQIHRPVVTVLTQVLVSPDDPAFGSPSKPIGRWYTAEAAAERTRAGWTMVEVPPHGFRRVVPSPEPLLVVEHRAVRKLLDAGAVVIALGGGGIPVVRVDGILRGVEAVVDKDLASALLAQRLGVDAFVIATDVDRVYLDFGEDRARGLEMVSTADLRRHAAAGCFPAGSMGPKVEALLRFVEGGGPRGIVTSHERLPAALHGHAGTHVIPAPQPRRPQPAGRALVAAT
jgi:carbamate kinase